MHICVHFCFILLCILNMCMYIHIYIYLFVYACIHVYTYIDMYIIHIYIYIFPKGDCQLMSPCFCSAPCTWRNSVPWDRSQIYRLPSFRHSFQTVPFAECVGPTGAAAAAGGSRFLFFFGRYMAGYMRWYWFNKSVGFHGKTVFFQWPPYFVDTICVVLQKMKAQLLEVGHQVILVRCSVAAHSLPKNFEAVRNPSRAAT